MNDQQPQVMTQPQNQMMSQQVPRHHPQMMMPPQHPFGPMTWPTNFPPLNPNPPNPFAAPKPRNWKGKKVINKKGIVPSGGVYRPPTLNELQHQNRMKAKRFFTNPNNNKKKFNNSNSNSNKNNRFAPYAPRNTTSFLIRAKKLGGIADLVSPCPVTPAVLPTPFFSPSREVLGDMAKEEWGVDGYGSMKGLIRLRSGGEGDEEEEGGDREGGEEDSDSDVEEHVEVERRLDHDLSRFEMIYHPNVGGGDYNYNNVLENRVDDQDTRIAQLEEENLILKERLFLMEREVGDFRRRMAFLERRGGGGGEEVNEEVVDNVSEENDSESRDDGHSIDGNNINISNNNDNEIDGKEEEEHGSYGAPEEDGEEGEEESGARDVCMNEMVDGPKNEVVVTENQSMDDHHLGVEADA